MPLVIASCVFEVYISFIELPVTKVKLPSLYKNEVSGSEQASFTKKPQTVYLQSDFFISRDIFNFESVIS